MSIDPSSIPSFGAPQPPQGGQPGGGPAGPPPVVVPDQALVTQLLDQMQLKHLVDDEGDLTAPWDGFRVYYMFRGEQKELFAVRAFYDRAYPLEDKGEILDLIDEWNRETLWPKVYTHTHEDGVVRLIGESQMIVGTGVNLDYFVTTTANWTQAAVGFEQWIVERLGLQKEIEGEQGEGEADGDASDEG
ncbi:YbjN domain-containing protein [Kitasatospora atroaurantiaca]|uniref:Putative sensory transduction regulator n=1 Tax=Kitasatospora atroaurantiaca TaxID=285545 RepID=A0A561ESB7_9ACTN|nr:YbjN domain-containing protein [Kitasatospora atroaurantiaca]TWE18503.1 putative sensory transduction regulator [Kitasatospora atroaurantiaca]